MRSIADSHPAAHSALRFSVLASQDIERIHEESTRVLAQTGIMIHYPPARALLASRGAQVDEATAVVRIPRALVEEALKARGR